MEKIKVAQIIGNAGNGGVEAYILNYYKAIDRNLVEFHSAFCSNFKGIEIGHDNI